MEFARKSKQLQKTLYFQSKKDIFFKKSIRLQDNVKEKYRKERLLVSEKEKLLKQINECGVLWVISKIEASVENFKTEKEKRVTLKIQLNFHQKVLNVKCCRSNYPKREGNSSRERKHSFRKETKKRAIEPTKKGNLKKVKESLEAVVTSTDDLVGKVEDHFCYLDDDAEEE